LFFLLAFDLAFKFAAVCDGFGKITRQLPRIFAKPINRILHHRKQGNKIFESGRKSDKRSLNWRNARALLRGYHQEAQAQGDKELIDPHQLKTLHCLHSNFNLLF